MFPAPNDGLVVQVKHYGQSIDCYSSEEASRLIPQACQQALQLMPASTKLDTFSYTEATEGAVKIPWLRDGDSMLLHSQNLQFFFLTSSLHSSSTNSAPPYPPGCQILVDLADRRRSSGLACWFDVWAAAVAIYELCIKHEEFGWADPIGESYRLHTDGIALCDG